MLLSMSGPLESFALFAGVYSGSIGSASSGIHLKAAPRTQCSRGVWFLLQGPNGRRSSSLPLAGILILSKSQSLSLSKE